MSDRNFTYLFYINLKNGIEYHLTSSVDLITLEGKLYLPFSGLSIESAEFNDSAQNNIVLHGTFEDLGITRNLDLVGAVLR